SEAKVRARMRRLMNVEWDGKTLVMEIKRDNGLDAYASAEHLIATVERSDAPFDPTTSPLPFRPAGREAVIRHSREHYARPRAEAERSVAEQLGHSLEESANTPQGEARRRLL